MQKKGMLLANEIFIEQSAHAIAMFDKEMRYISVSKKWMKDYKLNDIDIKGKSHYEIFPEIGDDWKEIHQACLKGEINTCDEAPFQRADGSMQWITWDVRPWHMPDNSIGGLLMFTADITDQKNRDFEKQRMEEILDKTNEVARIGTWEVDLITNQVKWSRITREIHEVDADYEPDLKSGINFYKVGESRMKIREAVDNAINHHKTFDLELQIVTAKGNIIWVRTIGQAKFENNVSKLLYGVFQDINEVVTTRQQLDKLNEELNTLLNAGHVSIIGTDINGIITHFNRGAEHLLQYSAAEMIGIHTPGKIHLTKEVENRGKELSDTLGKVIEGFEVFIAIAKQEFFESREWTYIRKDGTIFPVQLVVTPIKNLQGDITGYLGVATDISERKKAETELQTVLEITKDQNERLKNFAHIVSHNLRSHSGNIDMILDLFILETPAAAENEYISLLKKSSKNLKETISNLNEVVLMNVASHIQLIPINLYHVIQAAINNVSQLLQQTSLSVKNNLKETDLILGMPAYIDSIVLNFITNGIKYRSTNRKSKIILSADYEDEYLILKIEDNGIGIDLAKHGSKLFGMYKTFHGNEDARGIGLFITKNQVLTMGGKIEVESQVDEGTTFKIFFKYEKN